MVPCPEKTAWPTMIYTLTPGTDTNYECPASFVARNWTWHERQMRSDLSSLGDL
jgi:hypothetical protein